MHTSQRVGEIRLVRGVCQTGPVGNDGGVQRRQGRADYVGQEEGGCDRIVEYGGVAPGRGMAGITALF